MEKSKLINKVDSTTAEIYMYGVIGSGLDIDANVVVAEIENLRKKGCRNFRFYVNSEGGEVIHLVLLVGAEIVVFILQRLTVSIIVGSGDGVDGVVFLVGL